MKKQTIIIAVIFLISFSGIAQEQDTLSLSLEESISLALGNNLNLRKEELQAKSSEIFYKQSRSEILPSLNANFNLGMSNGRSIDPYTNNYVNEQLTFSNAGLSLNFIVFDGFRLKNQIQRDRLNKKASEMQTKAAEQELILQVTLAYLQVLNQKELVRLAKSRMTTTLKQLDRLRDKYELGKGNPADYFDMKGQLSRDKASVIQAKSSLKGARLRLSKLLYVDVPIVAEGLMLRLDLKEYGFTAAEVYTKALENMAVFEAKKLHIEATEEDISVSKSLYSPEISLSAQLGTNYSSSAQIFNQIGVQQVKTGGFVTVDNQTFPVWEKVAQYSSEQILFGDQYSNNLSSMVGVSINIPLFNGFRAKHSVKLKEIKMKEAKTALAQTKLSFKKAIKQAYKDMKAVYKRYQILKKQVAAYKESFRINEVRFNNGVSNIVAYIISKNNLDQAKINLINAKYEYILRVKVLNYYRGQGA